MLNYLKQYASTHLFYIVIIGIALVAFRSWMGEHDARLLADQQIKQSDAAVKASEQEISVLKQEMAANNEKYARDLASLEKTIAAVRTPAQAAKQIPQLVPHLPVPIATQPDNSISFPKEDVLPLFSELAEGKTCAVKLAQCQANYDSEQKIVEQKDAQIAEKDKTITAIRKPKGFWRRVGSTLKQVGIGVAIGATLGARL